MKSHSRFDPKTRPGGCLSVDISRSHVPGIWLVPDDSQFVVTRRARYFLVAHHQKYTPEEVNTILAAELTGQAPDLGAPRQEEQMESDFFGDEDVADESEDHPARGFWIYAYPLASKEAAEMLVAIQTVVGQVNSEFQGDVTRKIRLDLSADFTENPPGRSLEERSENGQEPKVSK